METVTNLGARWLTLEDPLSAAHMTPADKQRAFIYGRYSAYFYSKCPPLCHFNVSIKQLSYTRGYDMA